jgi:hypothetical protein
MFTRNALMFSIHDSMNITIKLARTPKKKNYKSNIKK